MIAANTQFAGKQAEGGAAGGNGGSVETSGHSLDIAGAQVDTSAAAGAAGTWLLDPDDYTIDAAQAATIVSNLASGNVTIMTSALGSGGNGDIFVNFRVDWSSANSLTLSAYRNIAVNANITNTGGASVVFVPTIPARNRHGQLSRSSAVSTSGVVSISTIRRSTRRVVSSTQQAMSARTENYSGNVTGGVSSLPICW